MSIKDEIRSIIIFAGDAWEAAVVKSLLENAEIQAFLKDEVQGTMEPWITVAGGAGAVKVIVSSADYDKAKQVVEDYNKNKE